MATSPLNVGRYALGERIAAGGMATVHLGRLVGSAGFSRTVAIKRLHPHLCMEQSFAAAFADEARLAARIRHPNVVPTLDVVSTDGELLIVMEYVDGEALSGLLRRSEGTRVPVPIVVAIVSEMLHGLHSAHEAKSETGKPLEIVHRDVSPQNVLVGADGVARLVDFGIARATARNRQASTGENDLKGKLAYMAPEQIRRENVTRRTDIYAAGIVLWELLTGKRLFASDNEAATMEKILVGWVPPPSATAADLPRALDDIVLRALDAEPKSRFDTARDMAVALEDAVRRALGREVAAWVEKTAAAELASRRALVAKTEEEGSPRSRASSVTAEAELPTTPRRGEFPKPPPSGTETTTVATATPTQPDRHVILADEPLTGPSPLDPGLAALETEKTMTSWGEPITQNHVELAPMPATRPPARSRVDRIAYAVFALATLVTLIVGLSWSKIAPSRPPPSVAPVLPPAPTVFEPTPAIDEPAPPPPAIISAPPPPVKKPSVVVKPRAPAKATCVSKLDPATGKKIYQGDCD